MRLIQYLLITAAVLAGLAISWFLVLRDLPSAQQWLRQEATTTTESVPANEGVASPDDTAASRDIVASNAPPPPDNSVPKPGSIFEAFPLKGSITPAPFEPPGEQATADPAAADAPPDEQATAGPAAAAPPVNARLALSNAQADQLRYVLLSHSIMQAETPDFPLRPGGAVPAEVPLTPLPGAVADIVPNFQHYSYVFTQNRIVVVLTKRREIGLVLSM